MTITNTARDERHPEWTLGGNPAAIEAQESRGQQELVNSTMLPIKMDPETREALDKSGVVFGKATSGDPLFCEATLPAGWKKRATDHSMWSELVDQDGKAVANIFYKAAFYDRDAFMRLA